MLCVAPFIFVDVLILVKALRAGIVMGRKTWEKAGGIAEKCYIILKPLLLSLILNLN